MLTQFQIDNLTKFLDTENDGFVSVDKFDVELRAAIISGAANVSIPSLVHSASGGKLGASFGGASSVSGKRRQKWA